MHFRKDINGLRAIAVMSIVLFHFNASWLPGGFAGVDVFFVISGFLMTAIIFNGIEDKNFSLVKFYIARANRIIPALAVLCFVLLIFGWFYFTPADYSTLGKHVGSSISFFSNIVYWKESGYFEAGSHEKWLLQTWSLSAEWQFYIIYPLILVTLKKFLSIRALKITIVIATIAGFIFCIYATSKWPAPAYYLLPTRAWEMTFGGIAYLYPLTLIDKTKKILNILGVVLILGSYLLLSKDNLWPGYLAIIPVFGTFLVIQSNLPSNFFTNNVVSQHIGLWSYSIYLWHWPLVVLIYTNSLGKAFTCGGVLLSILFGYVSYKFVEKANTRNKHVGNTRNKIYIPLISILSICLFSFLIMKSDGVDHPIREISTTPEAIYLHKYHRENYKKYISQHSKVDNSLLAGSQGIFIWGDSHAQALSYGIRKVFPDATINQVTTPGCRALIGTENSKSGSSKRVCDKANRKATSAILTIKPKVIILAQRRRHEKNDFHNIQRFINENELQSKIILVGPVPQWQPSLPSAIAKRHFNVNKKIIKDASFVNSLLISNKQLLKNYKNSEITHISIIDRLCSKDGCLAKVDNMNTPLVWDYGHLSIAGSIFLVEEFLKDEINKHLFYNDKAK